MASRSSESHHVEMAIEDKVFVAILTVPLARPCPFSGNFPQKTVPTSHSLPNIGNCPYHFFTRPPGVSYACLHFCPLFMFCAVPNKYTQLMPLILSAGPSRTIFGLLLPAQ